MTRRGRSGRTPIRAQRGETEDVKKRREGRGKKEKREEQESGERDQGKKEGGVGGGDTLFLPPHAPLPSSSREPPYH